MRINKNDTMPNASGVWRVCQRGLACDIAILPVIIF